MAEQLKACPCCGNAEITDSESYIMCMVCGLMIDRCDAPGNDYAKAWNNRAQLPSKGGEAVEPVEWQYQAPDGSWWGIAKSRIDEARLMGRPIRALYTQPADQVADDLNMVKVSRELLERAAHWLEMHSSGGGSTEGFCAEELRALLANNGGVKP